MKDDEIVELYWRRDESAIEETDKKYAAYCHVVADNILHSIEDSDECVNDTWLRAWNAIPPIRPANLKLFLAKITRNLALNRYKAKIAGKRGEGEIAVIFDELSEVLEGSFNVEDNILAKELKKIINEFLRTLKEKECNIFVRRYFFAEEIAKIAKRYGISENSVMVSLSRTRSKLRRYLEKEGWLV